MEFLLSLVTSGTFLTKVLPAIGAVVGIIMIYFSGQRVGKIKERNKQAEQLIKMMKGVSDADISARSDGARKRLRNGDF